MAEKTVDEIERETGWYEGGRTNGVQTLQVQSGDLVIMERRSGEDYEDGAPTYVVIEVPCRVVEAVICKAAGMTELWFSAAIDRMRREIRDLTEKLAFTEEDFDAAKDGFKDTLQGYAATIAGLSHELAAKVQKPTEPEAMPQAAVAEGPPAEERSRTSLTELTAGIRELELDKTTLLTELAGYKGRVATLEGQLEDALKRAAPPSDESCTLPKGELQKLMNDLNDAAEVNRDFRALFERVLPCFRLMLTRSVFDAAPKYPEFRDTNYVIQLIKKLGLKVWD